MTKKTINATIGALFKNYCSLKGAIVVRQRGLILFVLGTFFGLSAPYLFGPIEEDVKASSSLSDSEKSVLMKVTAYCPCEKCCGEDADGVTSTGKNARVTFGVAADPKVIPYGTKLLIPGVGIRKVDDTGGDMRKSARQGIYHIDVRFHSHEEALRFGVQWLKVKIL